MNAANTIGKRSADGVMIEIPVPTAGSGGRGIVVGKDGRAAQYDKAQTGELRP